MSQIEVLEKSPMSLAELKDCIDLIQKRDKELNFRSGKTLEFLNHFTTINSEKSSELKQKLLALDIPRLKEEHIVKIVDFLPLSIADLDVLIQGYPITIAKENQEKIISVVKDFK